MKILTVLGTRPELIRLSRIIPLLDGLCKHRFFHTGQNPDPKLKDIFFQELKIRDPDYILEMDPNLSTMAKVGAILCKSEEIMESFKPDRILILGDTNSGLAAYVAKRKGIPVFHMEAGNRCYDDRVPEEVNRRVIDTCSSVLLPYTEASRRCLLSEGYAHNRVYVTGNPIKEVIDYYESDIEKSIALKTLNLKKKMYFLVTLHREENVDLPERLPLFIKAFHALYEKYGFPVIVSTHPRTRYKMKQQNFKETDHVRFMDPMGFFDFIHLEKNAFCVLSDSGTVQEECALFHTPNVTLRDVTERRETLEVGSNVLSGADSEDIIRSVRAAVELSCDWVAPLDYLTSNVSHTVSKIILSYFKWN